MAPKTYQAPAPNAHRNSCAFLVGFMRDTLGEPMVVVRATRGEPWTTKEGKPTSVAALKIGALTNEPVDIVEFDGFEGVDPSILNPVGSDKDILVFGGEAWLTDGSEARVFVKGTLYEVVDEDGNPRGYFRRSELRIDGHGRRN